MEAKKNGDKDEKCCTNYWTMLYIAKQLMSRDQWKITFNPLTTKSHWLKLCF